MTFVSLTFLLFLPLVFCLHWLSRSARQQNLVIVIASYFFYGWWDWRFCGLMLLSTLIDYSIGIALGATQNSRLRKGLLTTSIVANLTVLGIFKYCNFFLDNLTNTLGLLGWHLDDFTLNVVLPVGISFYTFQTLSYTVDVYRGDLQPSRNLIEYLAFVSFFPQLVAGPIERATNLLPQFKTERRFDPDLAFSGLRLMFYGAIKKLLIADRLAVLVDDLYGSHGSQSGPMLMLATVFFAFQIYCDFSAYSDMARGTARLFSVQLIRNFDFPYFSTSISEFWRRWHISLSSWFRDYVYIPLGGSRCAPWLRTRNLMLTFVLSGVWHGAAWTFIVWGALQGLFLELTFRIKPLVAPVGEATIGQVVWFRVRLALRMLFTFSIVCLGWVFFRAETMPQALQILWQMLIDLGNVVSYTAMLGEISHDKLLKRAVLILIGFVLFEWWQRTRECPLDVLQAAPTAVRWGVYTVLLWGVLYLLPTTGSQKFIYFDF